MRCPRRASALPIALAVLLGASPLSPAAAASRQFRLSFAEGGHARIPFEVRGQHIWVRGSVNGADSTWIVVDTGASATTMDEGLAQRLSLPLTGGHQSHGAGGTAVGHTVAGVTMQLPGLKLEWSTMGTLDLSSFRVLSGRPMDVIVGYELFASCVVRFDYAAGVMDIWDDAHAPRAEPGETVPLTFIQNLPYVEGTLAVPGRAPIDGRFVLDSGSAQAVIVTPSVARDESLAAAFPRLLTAITRGVGGEVTNVQGRGESLTLGALRFDRPIVALSDSGAGHISATGTIGNIGGQVLGRCRVTFDYARKQMRLEPGPSFDRPFETDMSGMTVIRSPGGFTVHWINPDTPASEAGLKLGDVITRVDDAPAEGVDREALRLLLQNEGRTVRFTVQRGADSLDVAVKLRRLI